MLRSTRDDRERCAQTSSFPRRDAAGVMGGSDDGFRLRLNPSYVLRVKRRGWRAPGRHRSRLRFDWHRLRRPPRRLFDPEFRASGTGWRRGARASLPYPASPSLRAFAVGPDAPPLSHPSWRPLVVAVGGLLRAPLDVRTVVLSVGCGRDRQRTSPMPLSWPPRAPHPAPSTGRHR
jgi:hypothetical protein